MAFVRCPSCGSSSIRSSQIRDGREKFKSFFGFIPFRCKQCSGRFSAPIWNLRFARYARCPKCLRLELSTWSEQFYIAPLSTRLYLRMGATPYRCEFCRCNFASFRRCKERFSWRRRREARAALAAADALASQVQEPNSIHPEPESPDPQPLFVDLAQEPSEPYSETLGHESSHK